MDPLTAGLFVAASFASNLVSGRNQSRIEAASTNMQIAQSKLQSSEAAYERTKQFRQNLSSNLALSGLGIGGVSGFRATTAQNVTDYYGDIAAIGTQDLFNQASGNANRAANKARKFNRDINAFSDATTLAGQLGLFSSKGKAK